MCGSGIITGRYTLAQNAREKRRTVGLNFSALRAWWRMASPVWSWPFRLAEHEPSCRWRRCVEAILHPRPTT